MANEGEFPKSGGDVIYASEINAIQSRRSEVWIPLGDDEKSMDNTNTYTLVDTFTSPVILTKEDYPSTASFYLVAELYDGVTVYAILRNVTDSEDVSGSEVSTAGGWAYARGTSSSFSIPAGTKTYGVRFKSSATNTTAKIKRAWLKIIY